MRWPRRLPPVIPLFVAFGLPATAVAQSPGGVVQLNQYQPTPFSDRLLRLDGAQVLPRGQFRLGADIDYAFRPLVLTDIAPGISAGAGAPDYHLVGQAVGLAALASLGLGSRLEAAVAIPLTLLQTGEGAPGAVNPSIAGVGNPRLGLKAALLEGRGLSLGASLLAAIPAGTGTLTYEKGFGGEARLFGGYRRGRLSVGARVGFRLRSQQAFYDVQLGNEWTAAAGGAWQVAARTTALLEVAGATAAESPFADAKQSPLEALLGVRQRFGKTWFTLAAGPGLVNGYGSPLFRVVAAFTWANRPPDSDGDGIPDDVDRCPADPEDRDGFQDGDGCPDPDNDRDQILDGADRCPDAAEDRDGFQDGDGCPDGDNDKDGIPDGTDRCPDQPETVNDFEDEDGCPDSSPPAADKDKDGIFDDVDECPEEAEDKDGFEDEDGCPDLDNDKDGIPDASDKCPLQPETINGVDDNDGCPDKGQAQVRLGKNEIETLQPIYFDTDRSRVRHAFHNTLGQIASLLKAHPEIGRCGIEGHTDDTGPPEWNQKLSVLRAASVIEFLSARGVDRQRLVPIGHGEHLPWASNETPEGRAKNRRVVFHIEGINPDELKKQEQRQERRRRIRSRREQQQQQQQQQLQQPDKSEREKPGPTREAPPAQPPGTERPPLKAPGRRGDVAPHGQAEQPAEKKGDAPRPITPLGAAAPAATPPPPVRVPAPVPTPQRPPRVPAAAPAPAVPPQAPPAPMRAPAATLPAGADAVPSRPTQQRAPAVTSPRVEAPPLRVPAAVPPPAPPAPGNSAPREGATLQREKPVPPSTPAPRPGPAGTGRRRSADAGAPPPPTLRELLKLPPR